MCDQDFIDTLQLCDSQGDVSFESNWRPSERSYSLYCPPAAIIQTVTPPPSDSSLSPEPNVIPQNDYEDRIVSVSTAFHPGAYLLPVPVDLVLISGDGVLFYVHTTQILSRSINKFNQLVPPKPSDTIGSVSLPESAVTLNIVLHAVYDLSCAHYLPTIDALSSAVDTMAKYGIPPKQHITPSKPLYTLILSQAPINPVAAYALAAAHDLHELAVPVSSHLLSIPLQTLTRAQATKIGAMYLKKLFFLHLGRLEALRRLLLPAPAFHPATPTCGFVDQKRVARAWSLAAAHLAWDGRPDLPASTIHDTLSTLADYLSCAECKKKVAERVKQVVVQWSMVKRSI
ncbi:hypothetical protein C8Q74DRAFT_522625 [Fomes fomentarius]|nr:hypothetical protein C8Q74DRAFT_522625 [Fomes fomentarius]